MDDPQVKRLVKILGVAIVLIFVFKFIGIKMATHLGERKLQQQHLMQPGGHAQAADQGPAAPEQDAEPGTLPEAAPAPDPMPEPSFDANSQDTATPPEPPAAPTPQSPAPADGTGGVTPENGY